MRLLVAMMKHETNTFSPVPTDWRRFESWCLHRGEAVPGALGGTNTPIGAYLDLARGAGADIATPLAAEAMPSAPVERACFERMVETIVEPAAKGGFDGALLDLHGAMVVEHLSDGEGALLAELRRVAPGLPIACTYDLHCNLTEVMVENSTVSIGYKTYPHVDMYAVGEQIGRVLLRALAGEVEPVQAWGRAPLLAQTLRMGTADQPMKRLQAMAEAEEAGGCLAATLFGGFPLADIPDAGVSALTVADGDRARAEAARDRLLDAAWSAREDFVYRHRLLTETVAEAAGLEEGPVLLLDHADNVGSGGTQDVMTVIEEVRRQGLRDVAVAAVWDPAAVEAMQSAGVGATVTIHLGGRTDMPSVGLKGRPLKITGQVRVLSDGRWTVRGPMYTGMEVHTGPTAVLESDGMKIVVVSRHHEPWDLGIFTSVGIDPRVTRYLILKSRIHYRAGFAPIAGTTLTCDGEGVTTSDNSRLDYRELRRPIFPLDRINEF
ncbi:MAG: M81 family metallopeptidase [Kiloniellales bacterium]|nr:M81 family metallopeptidase [Kiloniellales bacterium]